MGIILDRPVDSRHHRHSIQPPTPQESLTTTDNVLLNNITPQHPESFLNINDSEIIKDEKLPRVSSAQQFDHTRTTSIQTEHIISPLHLQTDYTQTSNLTMEHLKPTHVANSSSKEEEILQSKATTEDMDRSCEHQRVTMSEKVEFHNCTCHEIEEVSNNIFKWTF